MAKGFLTVTDTRQRGDRLVVAVVKKREVMSASERLDVLQEAQSLPLILEA